MVSDLNGNQELMMQMVQQQMQGMDNGLTLNQMQPMQMSQLTREQQQELFERQAAMFTP
jgi:hypothetical protein